ncbi:MAG TPA: hypothetical protein VI603_01035 [Saprospiraceae bacterium]|nr:hypothetical protein [Saprospiraceae bacterium]
MNDQGARGRNSNVQLSLWDIESYTPLTAKDVEQELIIPDSLDPTCMPADGLWRNVDLIQGYQRMNDLQLETAIQSFEKALNGPSANTQEIEQMILICRDWTNHKLPKTTTLTILEEWLVEYQNYAFPSHVHTFKRALLRQFARKITPDTEGSLNLAEEIFDAHLDNQDYLHADDFITELISVVPDQRYRLYYLIAQAKYLAGRGHNLADEYYCIAMLHEPDPGMIPRVIPEELRELIREHGMALAPVIYTITRILPVYRLDKQMTKRDEEHLQAIEAYMLLLETEQARQQKSIHNLKLLGRQFSEMFPGVFAVYQRMVSAEKALKLKSFFMDKV